MNREKMLMMVTGTVIGIAAVLLVALGNPGNMGFCIACFLRDTAGALGLHRAGIVQYARPELIGLVLGAFIAAMSAGEFRSRGGSSTFVRFILGVFMMIGALVFLGCPLRDILRIGGGDLNAVVGLFGFMAGVFFGTFFLKRGFNLGAARRKGNSEPEAIFSSWLWYPFCIPLAGLTLILMRGPLFFSVEGPGSMRAPLWIALAAGLLVGFLAQKARLCLSGGFRDFFLIRDKTMLIAYGSIFLSVLILSLIMGTFKLGFADQPVAHTNHIFNFLGLFLVGQCAVLLGGCPLRQMILGSEGDTDAAMTVLGMIVGAAICHNFMLASSPKGTTSFGEIFVLAGIVIVSLIGWAYREVDA